MTPKRKLHCNFATVCENETGKYRSRRFAFPRFVKIPRFQLVRYRCASNQNRGKKEKQKLTNSVLLRLLATLKELLSVEEADKNACMHYLLLCFYFDSTVVYVYVVCVCVCVCVCVTYCTVRPV